MIIFLIGGSRKAQFGFSNNFSKYVKAFAAFILKMKAYLLLSPLVHVSCQWHVAPGDDLRCWHGGAVFHPWPGASGLACGAGVSSAR